MHASIATTLRRYKCFNFAAFKKWDRCLPQRVDCTKLRHTHQANSVSRLMVRGVGVKQWEVDEQECGWLGIQ
jgi:hypothetical protein